jgi:two-component system chemotaxis sensor kinase CheA
VSPAEPHQQDGDAAAGQTIRVTVDVLDNLMTLVSELVLTRNQLL